MVRTSLSHPLEVAEISAGPARGRIGLSFCPGKRQSDALTGAWARDLALDIAAIRDWGAASVVTLVEDHELHSLEVTGLGDEVRRHAMGWVHLPIPDMGVPDDGFERAWVGAGAALRAQLRDGSAIFIHCKGGLGRAGTISARLLVELGWGAEAAIAAVRDVRPGAIETSAQLAHVRTITAQSEPLPDRSEAAIRDRAVGALVGLAVGDALGTTLEFSRRDQKPLLVDMVGGGPFGLAPGQWTDDTAMALALGDSLLECGKLDETDLMQRFVRWRRVGAYSCTGHCFDIGATTAAALGRFERSGDPIAGATDPMAAGNGALMRLAPVAIRYWDDRVKLREAAARQSRTTHAAPEAVDGCVAYAELLADAIAGVPRSRVMAPRDEGWAGRVAPILAGSWRGKRRDAIRSSGYVAHSLEAALWSVGRSATFADVVLAAANLGDDADTVAAIAGQLGGALYGVGAIPAAWRETLAWRERIEEMADRLLAENARGVPL
jgi:ADP-ribosyl-[dinitrogen reductase] hydrolase